MSVRIAQPGFDRIDTRLTPGHRSQIDRFIGQRLIGVSPWAGKARAAAAAHATHDNPIILQGEPGTGKEMMARLIHQCSARRQQPFVMISCHGLSEQSTDEALFGSIRQLSSGGNRSQRGLVDAANGGTLYVKGSSALSPYLQSKLVRLIHYHEFRRAGENLLEASDVRLILGTTRQPDTNTNSADIMAAASDIFPALPLRQRKMDIEPLSRHFARQCCQQLGKEERPLTFETMSHLRRHSWSGNVRELNGVINEMVRQSTPPGLDPSMLPPQLLNPSLMAGRLLPARGLNLAEEVKRHEKALLCAALQSCQGRQAKAAKLLGLRRTTLNMKISRHDIDVAAFK